MECLCFLSAPSLSWWLCCLCFVVVVVVVFWFSAAGAAAAAAAAVAVVFPASFSASVGGFVPLCSCGFVCWLRSFCSGLACLLPLLPLLLLFCTSRVHLPTHYLCQGAAAAAGPVKMANLAQYDITPRMAPYLDPHFMFPILKWLREKNIYPEVDVLAAEYELSSKSTTMLSFVDETHKQLVEATKAAGRDASAIPPPALNPETLKAEFEARLKAGKGAWDILANKETVAELQKNSQLTLEGLVQNGATTAEVDSIFDLARFYHKSGLYKQALETIVLFRKIGPQDGSYRYFSTMWAQLAECICMLLNPDTPSTKKPLSSIGGNEPSDFALRVLRDTVEKRTTLEGVKEVEQRRWMMHWALFVIFSRPKPHEELFDLFFSPREARSEQRTRKNDYLAIAQAVSPWLLRYVAYSAVLNHKNIGKRQKQFVQILQAEKDNYSGPMTRLFTALFVEFDMDAALAAVRDSSDAIRADFFLGGLAARVRGGNVDAVVNDFQQAALRIGTCLMIGCSPRVTHFPTPTFHDPMMISTPQNTHVDTYFIQLILVLRVMPPNSPCLVHLSPRGARGFN